MEVDELERRRPGLGFPSFRKRKEQPDLRFYVRAFREADPDFGEEADADPADDRMSREWLIRSMR